MSNSKMILIGQMLYLKLMQQEKRGRVVWCDGDKADMKSLDPSWESGVYQ